jgi:hypothetical protein
MEQRFDKEFLSPCIGCKVQTESNNSCDDCPEPEFDVLEKDIAEEIKSFIRAEIEHERKNAVHEFKIANCKVCGCGFDKGYDKAVAECAAEVGRLEELLHDNGIKF